MNRIETHTQYKATELYLSVHLGPGQVLVAAVSKHQGVRDLQNDVMTWMKYSAVSKPVEELLEFINISDVHPLAYRL